MEGSSAVKTPDRPALDPSPGFGDYEASRLSPSQIRSLKSSSTTSPRGSESEGDSQHEPLRPGQKQKDPARQPHWVQTTWVTTLLIFIFLSFLVLYASFAEDRRHGSIHMGVTARRPFGKYAMFFPCETVGKPNPSCSESEPVHEKPAHEINTRQALDYVSKRDPPPGFEHWLKFAEENQCMTGSYTRIEKDLEAFRDSKTGKLRILRHHIDGARKMGNTAHFTVSNGQVTSTNGQLEFLDLMSRFVQYLPDMEFVVNIMDEPRVLPGNTEDVDERMASPVCWNASESFRKHRHLHGFVNNRQTGWAYDPNPELVALFSQTKVNECHRDIMFPTLYTLASVLPPEDEQRLIPWDQRKDVLFFRGSTTGGYFSDSRKEGLSHRQRLTKYAKGKPHMDIGITAYIQCDQEVCNDMELKYGLASRVEYMTNFDHKYLMSIDGNTFVSRLPRFMQSASLMFRAGIFDEWFEEWIEDGKHYLRVALDYSDLASKIQWAIDHDEEAKQIGLQGRDFSKKHLRKQDMECYLFRLLLEYANILEL